MEEKKLLEIFEIRPAFNFIKNNVRIYTVTAFILLIIFGGIFGYDNFIKNRIKEEPETQISFLVENKQGYGYTQADTLKELIVLNLSQEERLSSKVKDKLEENITAKSSKSSFITIEISDYSKKESNLLKKYIHNYLTESQLDFFKDKKIYNITTELPENQTEVVSGTSISAKKIILLLVIYFLFVLFIGTIIGVYREKRNSKISDFYGIKGKNKIYLDSYSETEKKKVIFGLAKNLSKDSIIVSEAPTDFASELLITDLSVDDAQLSQIAQVFILCKKDETTKSWYIVQEELASLFSENVTTIFY